MDEITEWQVISDSIILSTFFTDRSYLSLDWEPEIKKKYFDETVVEVNPMAMWARPEQQEVLVSSNRKVADLMPAGATASHTRMLVAIYYLFL